MLKEVKMPETREKTVDVLRRLKAQESKPKAKLESYSFSNPKPKQEEFKSSNLPQRNIEALLHKIEEIERKMKTGNVSYFNLYYELKNAEQTFLREAEKALKQDFQIPKTTLDRVKSRVEIIKSRQMEKR